MEMKTKLLFAALSLPFMFSACTQNEFEDAQSIEKVPANAIKGLVLNVQNEYLTEGVDTRAEWIDANSKIEFESGDKISMYWLGEEDGSSNSFGSNFARNSLKGLFNSIFRTENAESFTSESLVFEGGNIAVFPGDTEFYNQGELLLKVPQNQDATTIEKTPYISNQLYIKKSAGQTEQLPGYYGDKELDCPVKLAANVVNLTLNLSNIPQGFGFEVQEVELVASTKVFATESSIITKAEAPNYGSEVSISGPSTKNTIVAETWTKPKTKVTSLSTTNLTKVNENQVIAHFVVLPTDETAASTDATQIVVRTNCGTITMASNTKLDDNTTPKYQVATLNGETKVSIDAALTAFVGSKEAPSGKFEGENIGNGMRRSLDVNVAEAKLDGSYVYDSDDIKRYVNLYTAMNSTENPVELNLAVPTGSTETIFRGLTREAVTLLNGKAAFKLNKGTLTGLEIASDETGTVFDVPAINDGSNIPLYLAAGNWSMDDTFTLDAGLNGIYNNGTLTINGTNDVIEEPITNNGTINLNGSLVKVGDGFKTNVGSIINIGDGQELQFTTANTDGDLAGTINLNATSSKLTTTVSIFNNGIISNKGIIAGGTTNGWKNKGTINVTDATAITYIADNTNGTINLLNSTDEVKVDDVNKKGKIVYTWKATDGTTFAQDADDKYTYVIFKDITLTLTKSADALEVGTSMEFNGACTLKAAESDDITINNLIVNGDFRFMSGNKLTVSDLENNGTITIGGNINCDSKSGSGGRVLTTGAGAISEY